MVPLVRIITGYGDEKNKQTKQKKKQKKQGKTFQENFMSQNFSLPIIDRRWKFVLFVQCRLYWQCIRSGKSKLSTSKNTLSVCDRYIITIMGGLGSPLPHPRNTRHQCSPPHASYSCICRFNRDSKRTASNQGLRINTQLWQCPQPLTPQGVLKTKKHLEKYTKYDTAH